jgi:3-hydroxyisobutyrate dehydrogenase
MLHGVRVGFVGLGRMGEPMAVNLVRAGTALTVWNRSAPAAQRLAELGARVVPQPAEVFASCDVILAMLANGAVLDEVLGRHDGRFSVPVGGRTLVNMGTVAPEYSRSLDADIRAQGGSFVEAPVSGSRVPAQQGALVAMLAGDAADVARVDEVIRPTCASTFHCGQVPRALEMKLAVNVYLITMMLGLVEAVRFADGRGLDRALLRDILDAGTMASPLSRVKAAKLVAGDFSPQASVSDVLYNSRLILDAATQIDADLPLLASCAGLLSQAQALGYGDQDVVAVIETR